MATGVGGTVEAMAHNGAARDDLAGLLAELVNGHLCSRVADVLNAAATVARSALAVRAVAVNVQGQTEAGAAVEFGATDVVALRLQQLQSQRRSGPATVAADSNDLVAVADLAHPNGQVRDATMMLKQGVRAVLAAPVPGRSGPAGSFCAYDTAPRRWTASEIDATTAIARIAGALVENAAARNRQEVRTAQLQHALDSRIIIEQAKGVLAERRGLDPDAAFDALRSYARSNQLKVHDLAADIVAGRRTLPDARLDRC